MKILKLYLPLCVFLIIALFLYFGLNKDPHVIPSPLVGKQMPRFMAPELYHPRQTISDKSLKGKVILLNVFATWCVVCHGEHPMLMDIKNSNIVDIYGLNFKDQRPTVLKWLSQYGNPYDRIIFDPNGQIGINFGVYGAPATFLIDRNGIVRDKIIGQITQAIWKNRLLPEIKRYQKETG